MSASCRFRRSRKARSRSAIKKEAAPQRPLCIKAEETSRQPILKTLKRDHQILIANCVHARAKSVAAVKLLPVLQAGHIQMRAFRL